MTTETTKVEVPEGKGLGRLIKPDERDNAFPLRTLINVVKMAKGVPDLPRRRYWNDRYHADQENTGRCVQFGFANFYYDGPVTHKRKHPLFGDMDSFYQRSRTADGYPEDPTLQDGSTLRGAAKVLKEDGLITSYHWGRTFEELVETVALIGPVPVGTLWHGDMFEPDRKGYIHVSGGEAGGHCYVVDGVNFDADKVRVECAWDKRKPWSAFLSFSDMRRLIAEDPWFEICLAVEAKI